MQEYEAGTSFVTESQRRFSIAMAWPCQWPDMLFIQLDSCTRENKNRIVFERLESLLLWNVFEQYGFGFPPVGHTHKDIDQVIRKTACRLRSGDTIRLVDFHDVLLKNF